MYICIYVPPPTFAVRIRDLGFYCLGFRTRAKVQGPDDNMNLVQGLLEGADKGSGRMNIVGLRF